MPHCIIEYSTGHNSNKLIEAVHEGAIASGIFDSNSGVIKIRPMEYAEYKVGNTDLGFVHVTLKILSERDSNQKSELSRSVSEKLKSVMESGSSLTVEVVEMDRDSYTKGIV